MEGIEDSTQLYHLPLDVFSKLTPLLSLSDLAHLFATNQRRLRAILVAPHVIQEAVVDNPTGEVTHLLMELKWLKKVKIVSPHANLFVEQLMQNPIEDLVICRSLVRGAGDVGDGPYGAYVPTIPMLEYNAGQFVPNLGAMFPRLRHLHIMSSIDALSSNVTGPYNCTPDLAELHNMSDDFEDWNPDEAAEEEYEELEYLEDDDPEALQNNHLELQALKKETRPWMGALGEILEAQWMAPAAENGGISETPPMSLGLSQMELDAVPDDGNQAEIRAALYLTAPIRELFALREDKSPHEVLFATLPSCLESLTLSDEFCSHQLAYASLKTRDFGLLPVRLNKLHLDFSHSVELMHLVCPAETLLLEKILRYLPLLRHVEMNFNSARGPFKGRAQFASVGMTRLLVEHEGYEVVPDLGGVWSHLRPYEGSLGHDMDFSTDLEVVDTWLSMTPLPKRFRRQEYPGGPKPGELPLGQNLETLLLYAAGPEHLYPLSFIPPKLTKYAWSGPLESAALQIPFTEIFFSPQASAAAMDVDLPNIPRSLLTFPVSLTSVDFLHIQDTLLPALIHGLPPSITSLRCADRSNEICELLFRLCPKITSLTLRCDHDWDWTTVPYRLKSLELLGEDFTPFRVFGEMPASLENLEILSIPEAAVSFEEFTQLRLLFPRGCVLKITQPLVFYDEVWPVAVKQLQKGVEAILSNQPLDKLCAKLHEIIPHGSVPETLESMPEALTLNAHLIASLLFSSVGVVEAHFQLESMNLSSLPVPYSITLRGDTLSTEHYVGPAFGERGRSQPEHYSPSIKINTGHETKERHEATLSWPRLTLASLSAIPYLNTLDVQLTQRITATEISNLPPTLVSLILETGADVPDDLPLMALPPGLTHCSLICTARYGRLYTAKVRGGLPKLRVLNLPQCDLLELQHLPIVCPALTSLNAHSTWASDKDLAAGISHIETVTLRGTAHYTGILVRQIPETSELEYTELGSQIQDKLDHLEWTTKDAVYKMHLVNKNSIDR